MRQATTILSITTLRRGLLEISGEVSSWLEAQAVDTGLLTLFCRHTSAALLIQENAAAEVRADLEAFFERLVPEQADLYTHNDEGSDDMPAHIRTALTQVQLAVPVMEGRLVLGTWQGIYLFEHRRRRRVREIAVHLIGK
jgi:secondary thiamine-phosphate synthase enzyme